MGQQSSFYKEFLLQATGTCDLAWLLINVPGSVLRSPWAGGHDPPLGSLGPGPPLLPGEVPHPYLGLAPLPIRCSGPLWSRVGAWEAGGRRCPGFDLGGRKHLLILVQGPQVEISGLMAAQRLLGGGFPMVPTSLLCTRSLLEGKAIATLPSIYFTPKNQGSKGRLRLYLVDG